MTCAVVFSVPMTVAPGFYWRWRSVDGKSDSTDSFLYYYDCVANARAKGYEVQPTKAHGETAPQRASL